MPAQNLCRSIVINLYTVLKSKNFWISAMVVFASLLAESIQDIPGRLTPNFSPVDPNVWGSAYRFNLSIHFGLYIYAVPLACAFASSGLFCDDVEAGFYRLRLMKVGGKPYQYGLFIGGTLGGGISVALGVTMYAILCSIIYLPIEVPHMAVAESWIPVISSSIGNLAYMAAHIGLALIFGIIWSGVGLTISIYTPARYVSYMSPFIICFCSVVALPQSLQPLEMLVQMGWRDFTFVRLLLYQSTLYIVVMTCFISATEKRVLHE